MGADQSGTLNGSEEMDKTYGLDGDDNQSGRGGNDKRLSVAMTTCTAGRERRFASGRGQKMSSNVPSRLVAIGRSSHGR